MCNKPLVAHPSLTWCLERKIPVGRRPFSQAGRRRSSFSGDEEQSPPPYPTQGPNRPRPRTHLHQTHKSGNVTLMTIKTTTTTKQQTSSMAPSLVRREAVFNRRQRSESCSQGLAVDLDAADAACSTVNQLLFLYVFIVIVSSCRGRPVCRVYIFVMTRVFVVSTLKRS